MSSPFGEWQRTHAAQGAIAGFLGKALRGEPVQIWGDGSLVRDYVYIGDAVEAIVAAARYRGPEKIFNIGSGQPRTLLQILAAIEQATGKAITRQFLPGRVFDVPVNLLAIERARTHLAWVPRTGFNEGLQRMANWLLVEGA